MSNPLAKSVFTLLTGTAVAQLVPILLAPVLTRLYTPSELGVLAFVTASSAILTVIVTGRYELAIVTVQRDAEAFRIALIACGLACTSSLLLLLLLWLARRPLDAFPFTGHMAMWLFVAPISALFGAINQTINYWRMRNGHYRRMSVARMMQSSTAMGLQIACGYVGIGAAGLILGQLGGQLASTLLLAGFSLRTSWPALKSIRLQRLAATARRHHQFPKYLVLGQGANVLSSQLPVLMLGTLFGGAIAGHYALAQRAVAAPLTLIGNAIGDVFRSEAAKQYNRLGNCIDLFKRAFKSLACISVLVSAPLIFASPRLFSIIFGAEWRTAGEISSMLSIMLCFQMISSPLSQTVFLKRKMLRADLIWQVCRAGGAGCALYIGFKMFGSYRISIALFVGVFCLLYSIHSYMQYKAALGQQP